MSPILPPFHKGRANVSGRPERQSYGAFGEWVGDLLRGRFRRHADVRNGSLKLEKIRRPDGRGYEIVARPIQPFTTVPGMIQWTRQHGRLDAQKAEFLRKFIIRTLSLKTYREWLASFVVDLPYDTQRGFLENYRTYALSAMACFVEFFRPGKLNWQVLTPKDRRLVQRLMQTFAASKSDPGQQRKLLQRLFDLKEDLAGLMPTSTRELSESDRELLLECLRLGLKGEERARWLAERGFKGFGMSPLTKYRESPNSMRALLSKWTKQVSQE